MSPWTRFRVLLLKYTSILFIFTIFVPIILSFLSDEKRKNNVYPNKKEKKTAPAESLLLRKTDTSLRSVWLNLFCHSGGFSGEWSRAKQTYKQDVFNKTTLRHSEGNARRNYIKSTRNSIDIEIWVYIKIRSEFIKITPFWNGCAFCFFV